jgi:hypothetical protein
MNVCQNLRAALIKRAAKIQAGQPLSPEQLQWFTDLVACCDWPGRTLVGVDGAHAASVIAAHCPRPAMHQWLPGLRTAVSRGDAPKRHLERIETRLGN